MSLTLKHHNHPHSLQLTSSLLMAAVLPALAAQNLKDVCPEANNHLDALTNAAIPKVEMIDSSPHASPTNYFRAENFDLSRSHFNDSSIKQPSATSQNAAAKAEASQVPTEKGGVLQWLHNTLDAPTTWVANIVQIAGAAIATSTLYYGISSYRRNPCLMLTENIFLKPDEKPGFINTEQKDVKDHFKDGFQRFILNTAFHKATEAFPILFINSQHYPEIPSLLRGDLVSIDADTTVAALGLAPEELARLHEWHLLIVARRDWLGETPVIKRDFFTFQSFIKMLESPLEVFESMKGSNRKHLLHHLEGAALIAYLHPELVDRAIQETSTKENKGSESSKTKAHLVRENSRSLLRLLGLSTKDSLESLDAAVANHSLNDLLSKSTDQEIDAMIEHRRERTSVAERLLEPVIRYIWRRSWHKMLGISEAPSETTDSSEYGIYDFFSVAHMTSLSKERLAEPSTEARLGALEQALAASRTTSKALLFDKVPDSPFGNN